MCVFVPFCVSKWIFRYEQWNKLGERICEHVCKVRMCIVAAVNLLAKWPISLNNSRNIILFHLCGWQNCDYFFCKNLHNLSFLEWSAVKTVQTFWIQFFFFSREVFVISILTFRYVSRKNGKKLIPSPGSKINPNANFLYWTFNFEPKSILFDK